MRSSGPTLPFAEPPVRHVWSVAELVRDAGAVLEQAYPAVWVRGEVGNFRPAASGHWYFNLKDDGAVLPAAMFRSDNSSVPFEPEDGLEVVAFGRLAIFDRTGKFQLIANAMEPVGWGAHQLAFEQLRRRLASEGLLDPERKRALPELPGCVGVVTSSTGAAWHDMTRVWQRRQVPLRAILAPCRVQGPQAGAEIAAAIRDLDSHGRVEVIIVTRGGGSREDLWPFNEDVVARAIAEASVPVISAVGHEIDVTIADLVADRRAATPTAAAEIVAAARGELMDRLTSTRRRLDNALEQRLQRGRTRLESRWLHRALSRPESILQSYEQRLDQVTSRLLRGRAASLSSRASRLAGAGARLTRQEPTRLLADRSARLSEQLARSRVAMGERLHRARQALGTAAARTEALSPLAVLGRGYALCQVASGEVLRSADGVERGDLVRVTLSEGRLSCRVEEQAPGTARTFGASSEQC